MANKPSGWQTCTKGWTKVEGESIMTPNRATEKTVNNSIAHYILARKGTGATLEEIKAAKEILASTIRKIYTGTANTDQLGQATTDMNNNKKATVQNNCWLCGLNIFKPQEFTNLGGANCLGYQEAEHVLPLKIGHKLLSLPGQKIGGNINTQDLLYQQQIQLEMKNSHRLCNQIKSNINFIKFSGGWQGTWSIKGDLVTAFIQTINSCMIANNNCGTPPLFVGEATDDLMVKGLTAVCDHLNTVKLPPWDDLSDEVKNRLYNALPNAFDEIKEEWDSPLGYILYRYSSKIARPNASNDTITKYIRTTYNRYISTDDDNINKEEKGMREISQSITGSQPINPQSEGTPSDATSAPTTTTIKTEVLEAIAEDGVEDDGDGNTANTMITNAVDETVPQRTRSETALKRQRDEEKTAERARETEIAKEKAAPVAKTMTFSHSPPPSPPPISLLQRFNRVLNNSDKEISELPQ